MAQAILPVALYYSARRYAGFGLSPFLGAAVSWFALAIAVIITFVYGSLFVALWLLLLGDVKRKKPLLEDVINCRTSGRQHMGMPSRKPYPTDVSDEEWAFVGPSLASE